MNNDVIHSPNIEYSLTKCKLHIETGQKHPVKDLLRNKDFIRYDSVNSAVNSYDTVPVDRVFANRIRGSDTSIKLPERSYPKLFENAPKTYPNANYSIRQSQIITGEQMYDMVENYKPKNVKDKNAYFGDIKQIFVEGEIPDPADFFKKLANFPLIRVLQLKNTSLSDFDFEALLGKPLAELTILEMSGKLIKTHDQILSAIRSCPKLQAIDYRNTDLQDDRTLKKKIISKFPNIDLINQDLVTSASYAEYIKDKSTVTQDLKQEFFRNMIIRLPEIRYFTMKFNKSFSPDYITVLQLANMNLTNIYLSEFTELVSLSLAGNLLTTMRKTGIERCQKLITVDLSYNLFDDVNCIKDLGYIPSLLHIYMHSNEIEDDNYRSSIIKLFRFLPGTALLTGIQSIDGVPVTIEEYVLACGASRDELADKKWIYNLQQVVGGNFIKAKMVDFAVVLTNLVSLSLPCRGLHRCDLQNLANLKYLNLRGNFLINVHNLGLCGHLECLDLSDNVFLNIYSTQEQIKCLPKLYYLNLAVNIPVPKVPNGETLNYNFKTGSALNKNYRFQILATLLPHCPNLTYLDRIKISPVDRYQYALGFQNIDPAIFQFLHFFQEADFHFSIQDLYKPQVRASLCNKIFELSIFNKIEYIYDFSFLSSLKNVTHLDLSPDLSQSNIHAYGRYLNLFLNDKKVPKIPSFIYELKYIQILNLNQLNLERDIEGRVKVINTLKDLTKFDCHNVQDKDDLGADFLLLSEVLKKCTNRLFDFTDKLYHVDVDLNIQALHQLGIQPDKRNQIIVAAKFTVDPKIRMDKIKYLDFSNLNLSEFSFSEYNDYVRKSMVKKGIIPEDDRPKWKELPKQNPLEYDVRRNLFYLDLSDNLLNHDTIRDFRFYKLRVLNLSNNNFTDPQKLTDMILKIPSLKNVIVSPQKNPLTDLRPMIIKGIAKKIWNDLNAGVHRNHYKEEKIPIDGNLLAKFFIEYPLKAIDDKWIMPSEISPAISSVTGNSYTMPPVFKLCLAKTRYDPRYYVAIYYNNTKNKLSIKIRFSNLTDTMHTKQVHVSYDYSECELDFNEKMKFSNFGIKDEFQQCLNLSKNNIDEKQLENIIFVRSVNYVNGFMNEFDFGARSLRQLNLQNNNIRLGDNGDAREFVKFLSYFPSLEELHFENNPIAEKKYFEIFIDNFDMLQKPEYPIKIINHLQITHEWRLDYIKKRNPTKLEFFISAHAISLVMGQNVKHQQFFDFSFKGIVFLDRFADKYARFMNITTINLSNNRIRYIPGNIFDSFPNLSTLDLSENEIEPYPGTKKLVDAITIPLSNVKHLKNLTITNCFKKKRYKSIDYFSKVCMRLRMLKTLNGATNPHYYTYTQKFHAEKIKKLIGLKNIPTSDILDLSNADLGVPDIANQVAGSCDVLKIKKIILPTENLKDLQYIFLTKCESITKINYKPVDFKHRLQARKEYSKHFENFVLPEFIEDKMGTYETISGYIDKITEAPAKYGSLVSKFEIFITFEQILQMIVRYIKQIKWPHIFLKLSSIILLLAINIESIILALRKVFSFAIDVTLPTPLKFFQFFLYSVIPVFCIFMYGFDMSKEFFYKYCQSMFKRTIWICVWLLFIMLICVWGLAGIFTLNDDIYHQKIHPYFYGYGFWLTLFCLAVFFVLIFGVWFFKRNADRDKNGFWWDEFKVYRSSLCLFIITVLYEPSISFFTSILQCGEDGDKTISAAFEDLLCVDPQHPIQTLNFAHFFAFIFMVVYAIWIPVLFVIEIIDAVKYIRDARGILLEEEEIKRLEKQIKILKKYDTQKVVEQYNQGQIDTVVIDSAVNKNRKKHDLEVAKKYLKHVKMKLANDYADEVHNYDHPASYLYNQYTLKMRFMKILDMVQKVGIIVFGTILRTFILGQIAVHVIVHAFLAISVIFQPFFSGIENLLKKVTQGGNSGTIIIGEVLQTDKYSKWVNNPLVIHLAAPALLLILLFGVSLTFLFLIIKYHCKCSCKKKKNEAANAEEAEEANENNNKYKELEEIDFGYCTLKLDYDGPPEVEEQDEVEEVSDKPVEVITRTRSYVEIEQTKFGKSKIVYVDDEKNEGIKVDYKFKLPDNWDNMTVEARRDFVESYNYKKQMHWFINGVEGEMKDCWSADDYQQCVDNKAWNKKVLFPVEFDPDAYDPSLRFKVRYMNKLQQQNQKRLQQEGKTAPSKSFSEVKIQTPEAPPSSKRRKTMKKQGSDYEQLINAMNEAVDEDEESSKLSEKEEKQQSRGWGLFGSSQKNDQPQSRGWGFFGLFGSKTQNDSVGKTPTLTQVGPSASKKRKENPEFNRNHYHDNEFFEKREVHPKVQNYKREVFYRLPQKPDAVANDCYLLHRHDESEGSVDYLHFDTVYLHRNGFGETFEEFKEDPKVAINDENDVGNGLLIYEGGEIKGQNKKSWCEEFVEQKQIGQLTPSSSMMFKE